MPTSPASPPARRPTMNDVAAAAGVSLKTVSRVVNQEAHVRPEVATRVADTIEALGYRPDRRARDLAASRAPRTVGFVQVDAANPFFAAVYRGLEDQLRGAGLLIVAGSTDAEPARERQLLETLIEFRVDGFVVAAAEGNDELLLREVGHGTPVVCVDRVLDDRACDTVVSSNRASTDEAVTHLLDRGHRRIAFLGGQTEVWTARERVAGYRQAMMRAGAPLREVTHVDDPGSAARATRELLAGAEAPTALVTAQDRITVGTIAALHELGRQHDVALFGFDELPFAEQLEPSISVVAQDPYRMGARAAQLLLARFTDPGAEAAFEVIPAPLRHRGSGDILPTASGDPAS